MPERWDEELEAPLPHRCDCGGHIEELAVEPQYQTDIPKIQPRVTRINVHIGRCQDCGKRHQGRHPRHVSDALGAAASHLGPNALGLAAYLNKGLGMPFGKLSDLYETHFSLSVTPGGLCLALHRVRRSLTPTYEAIVLFVRSSPYVVPDETGWKVGGRLWWLWVFANPSATVYAILPGRGFEQAASVLGEDYAGRLTRDGWGGTIITTNLFATVAFLGEAAQSGGASAHHGDLRPGEETVQQDQETDRGQLDQEAVIAHDPSCPHQRWAPTGSAEEAGRRG